MTYAELVQKIRDYTETDSNVLTATIVDGFIEDAEWRIFRDVDSDNNKRYATHFCNCKTITTHKLN